ncbi:hypothetical protein N7517_007979 [Penicillium concentricum]|uniref:Short-chain dehydrogenase/reductase SDR n=1 Tax=Penicillium concentricum TaxID=293559 RepID=A0A9W9V190_9EURO|nr:uncharacterized protein N7517_007979 [Penicillium concentricum]KAJ5365093.1 hypothetical protein N7517_007979 [Penicillium concentricum]
MPRIWFITGCSSGFGRQLAITAAESKDTVVATSRDPSKLSDLTSMGVIAKKLDVQASDDDVKAVIDDIVSTVGPIDILVNNAGSVLGRRHRRVQMRVLRAALPSMRARKSGVVANFGSIAGWQSDPAVGMYCATKAAIALYTETLLNELAPFNIEVTCVEPGYFRTNFLTGGHKVTTKNRIPELDTGTQDNRDALAAISLHQPGDPIKGAQVLFEAFTKTGRCEGRSLPGRLALGRDSLSAIAGSIAREQEMLDSWKEIIGSTGCDDVQV